MSVPRPAAVRVHGVTFDVAAFSEQGPRPENQDAFSAEHFERTGLVAVADGMGGERGGRLAAETALRALLDAAPIGSLDGARRAVRAADQQVAKAALENPAERGGMGCALALLSLARTRADGPGWIGAHVGDVRILSRSPDGATRLETRDHTPAFARWEAGEIELDEIPETEGANRLQRAVGRGGEADVVWLPARPGWSYLLISDGITKTMRLDELGDAMATPDATAACDAIRRKVEERGPDDNFTALLVRIVGDAESTAPFPEPRSPGGAPVTAMSPRRSAGTVIVGLLAAAALVTAGFALWTARALREEAAIDRTEVVRLRTDVDSLRLRVTELAEPFGPSAETELPTPPATAAPATQP